VKPGRNRAKADEKITDESSKMKQERPLSPNLSDFVIVSENFSFDSSGINFLLMIWYFSYSVFQRWQFGLMILH